MAERRGRIIFSATYRPPAPLDIFSCPFSPSSIKDEVHLTDGVSYNYNGRAIPPAALKTLLKSPKLADEGIASDADVSGMVFVSERDDGLETLYIALRFIADSQVKVFALADIFDATDFSGGRLEDSGCIGGGYNVGSRTVDHCLIYVSTKEPVQERRSPWTVVYKTNLATGRTERLTPQGVFDLSPSVSPSGKKVAVASFESTSWNGEIENLKTDIYVMNVDSEECQGLARQLLIKNGGWPSWGSDNIIFFHRGTDKTLPSSMVKTTWGVFRYNISTDETVQVTPEEFDAVTPAAITETEVAVATIRQKSSFSKVRVQAQYRHIEIFDMNAAGLPPVQITQKMRPKGDHYNPFVLDGGGHIGYHRCRSSLMHQGDHVPENLQKPPFPLDNGRITLRASEVAEPDNLHKLESPEKDVGLCRVSGVFPNISKDSSKLAFVDREFKAVWVGDSQGLRIVYESVSPNKVFSPVWNQNPDKDTLYVCVGSSFNAHEPLEIYAIRNASGPPAKIKASRLTNGGLNNAFPSSNPQGTKLVFRAMREYKKHKMRVEQRVPVEQPTRHQDGEEQIDPADQPLGDGGGHKKYKNLFIMIDAGKGELWEGWETRLTKGEWTDTHCQWSPNGDWIVFSSTRDKPASTAELDDGLDAAYLSVYMVKANDPTVVIRVMSSGGRINHPVFSPDGRSIAMTADLAAVSVDPMSLPMFGHTVRTYGDIFVVDINPDDDDSVKSQAVVKGFRRITHSRYECGTPAWTGAFAATSMEAYTPAWPYLLHEGDETWHMIAHLCIPKRAC